MRTSRLKHGQVLPLVLVSSAVLLSAALNHCGPGQYQALPVVIGCSGTQGVVDSPLNTQQVEARPKADTTLANIPKGTRNFQAILRVRVDADLFIQSGRSGESIYKVIAGATERTAEGAREGVYKGMRFQVSQTAGSPTVEKVILYGQAQEHLQLVLRSFSSASAPASLSYSYDDWSSWTDPDGKQVQKCPYATPVGCKPYHQDKAQLAGLTFSRWLKKTYGTCDKAFNTLFVPLTDGPAVPRYNWRQLYEQWPAAESNMILTGGENVFAKGMGVFAHTETPDGAKINGKPIYKNLHGMYLYFEKLHGAWAVSNAYSQNVGQLISKYHEDVPRPHLATGWKSWFPSTGEWKEDKAIHLVKTMDKNVASPEAMYKFFTYGGLEVNKKNFDRRDFTWACELNDMNEKFVRPCCATLRTAFADQNDAMKKLAEIAAKNGHTQVLDGLWAVCRSVPGVPLPAGGRKDLFRFFSSNPIQDMVADDLRICYPQGPVKVQPTTKPIYYPSVQKEPSKVSQTKKAWENSGSAPARRADLGPAGFPMQEHFLEDDAPVTKAPLGRPGEVPLTIFAKSPSILILLGALSGLLCCMAVVGIMFATIKRSKARLLKRNEYLDPGLVMERLDSEDTAKEVQEVQNLLPAHEADDCSSEV